MKVVDIQHAGTVASPEVLVKMDQKLPQGVMGHLKQIFAEALKKHGDTALHIQDGVLILEPEFAKQFRRSPDIRQLEEAVEQAHLAHLRETAEAKRSSDKLVSDMRAAAGLSRDFPESEAYG